MRPHNARRPGMSVEVDLERLTLIQKALGARYAARVGILGKTASRKAGEKGTGPTNAFVGLVHEKGSKSGGIPRRSFLADTFFRKGKRLTQIRGRLWKWFTGRDPTPARFKQVYGALGHQGEVLVDEAFDTGGFGAWPKLKASTIKRKGSSAILIDTAQLRRAITSDVVSL